MPLGGVHRPDRDSVGGEITIGREPALRWLFRERPKAADHPSRAFRQEIEPLEPAVLAVAREVDLC
jgi:hypothetical protein